jgi:hypothetical protein
VKGFVDQCRREWERLGVPDAIANEMAADLAADLAEAEADGVSAEEVLGTGIFDPRAFAASWAEARGLLDSPATKPRRRRGPLLVAAVAGVSVLVAALALAAFGVRHGSVSVARVRHPFEVGPGTFRVGPLPGGLVDHSRLVPDGLLIAVAVLFIIGMIGVVTALVYWSTSHGGFGARGRDRHRLSH